MSTNDGQEWLAFYERFNYFTQDSVRDGCHPRIFRHATPSGMAVVLVHGLTDSPYRYVRLDVDGAKELARLIKETDDWLKGFDAKAPFPKRIFAAPSECDETAAIQGVETLQKKTATDAFTAFYIPEAVGVSHAELVLEEPIRALDAAADDPPLENANPQFG